MSGNRYRPLLALVASCLGLIALLAIPAGAAAKDRNHDRIPDRWEKANHLSTHVNQSHRDQDRDRLDNRHEFLAGDNPRDADSDNDGTRDGDENAGRIASFDAASGRLVINLFGGDTLSGQVTDGTEIKCENENENENETNDRHRDNSGPGGSNEAGDDNGQDQNDNDDENENSTCTTADLTAGTVVEEAELHTVGGSAVFEEVELGS